MMSHQQLSTEHWRNKHSRRERLMKRLMARHLGLCAHCGKQCVRARSHIQEPDSATIDHHPTPRCDLPVEEWFNLDRCVLACFACNQASAAELQKKRASA